jgi:putative transposase
MEDVLQVRNDYRLQQWRRIIRQCRESGLSNRNYCKQNGISEKTFYYWLRKLRSAAAEVGSPQIVRLDETQAADDMIRIQFRSASLILPEGTDADAVAAVLRSLQQL